MNVVTMVPNASKQRLELSALVTALPGISVTEIEVDDYVYLTFVLEWDSAIRPLLDLIESDRFCETWNITVKWDNGLRYLLVGETSDVVGFCGALRDWRGTR